MSVRAEIAVIKAQIAAHLDLIHNLVEARAVVANPDSGHVGSLKYAENRLREIVEFLGGEQSHVG